MDHFSLLPDNLISTILSFLPFPESARTSILSRRWRPLWTGITRFDIFAQQLSLDNPAKQIHYVDNILARPELGILSFKITLCPSRAQAPVLARWAGELVRRGVSELGLINAGEIYTAPPCLLTCKTLTVLKLHLCKFDDSLLVACTGLRSLELVAVSVSDATIRDVASVCERLESLKIKYCSLYEVVVHNERLRCLLLTSEVSRCDIDVEAPNLEELELDMMCYVKRARVFTPKLRRSSICLQGSRLAFDRMKVQQLVAGVESIEDLRLEGAAVQCLYSCISSWKSATRFQNLKKLCITLCTNDSRQSSVLSAILRTCSQLQDLRVEINGDFSGLEDPSIKKEPFDCPSDRLQQAEVIGFTGNTYEVEMVKFLLTTVQVVKGVVLEYPGKCSKWKEAAARDTVSKILDEIARPYTVRERENLFSLDIGEKRIRIRVEGTSYKF